MGIENLIADPTLLPLLQTTQDTLRQTESILAWLQENDTSESPSVETQLYVAQEQKLLHAYLAKMRSLHRRAAFDARATKQETAEARQEVDRLLLQLQNLYYEQRHLMGEIDACEGYDHAYTHLPLISQEEYLSLFPEHDELSEQELMPRRIEHEKQEREMMEEQRLELVKAKEALTKENTRKKEEMRKMDEKLEAVIDELKPIEETLMTDL